MTTNKIFIKINFILKLIFGRDFLSKTLIIRKTELCKNFLYKEECPFGANAISHISISRADNANINFHKVIKLSLKGILLLQK